MGFFRKTVLLLLFAAGAVPAATEPLPAALPSGSIVRLSRIEVDPARLPEYLELVTECGRQSMAKEPGVLWMFSMQEQTRPERITILEIYANRAAYLHHIRTAHFRKYKEGTREMVRKLELLDQTPLVPEMRMK